MIPIATATPTNAAGIRIVRLAGTFTFQSLVQVQSVLRAELAEKTIIDLTDVPYVDSAALGTLVAFHVSCGRDGRKYALTGLNARVIKLMAVCFMDTVLTTYPTIEDAERAFTEPAR